MDTTRFDGNLALWIDQFLDPDLLIIQTRADEGKLHDTVAFGIDPSGLEVEGQNPMFCEQVYDHIRR